MANYEVTFVPCETFRMTYHVECNDPDLAQYVAITDLRDDVGYDHSKDFEVLSIKEVQDNGS